MLTFGLFTGMMYLTIGVLLFTHLGRLRAGWQSPDLDPAQRETAERFLDVSATLRVTLCIAAATGLIVLGFTAVAIVAGMADNTGVWVIVWILVASAIAKAPLFVRMLRQMHALQATTNASKEAQRVDV